MRTDPGAAPPPGGATPVQPARAAAPPQGESTLAVHAGAPAPAAGAPVVTPVYSTSTFYTDPVPTGEVLYTRYGTNPNQRALAAKIAALEHAEAAMVLASGNAACALALLSCVGAGQHVLAQRELYGGTLRLLERELPRLGIETTFLPLAIGWRAGLRDNTGALLMEVPVNPTLRVLDMTEAATLARDRGIPLIVDATFATPFNFRPLEHGADLVFHSATKYLGGHSDLSAGVVSGSAARIAEVRELLKSFGPVLDPHAVWLLERGVKTLAVRMARHNENGLAIARWLEQHAAVEEVFYPGLASHPDHERARRLFRGYGGVVSLRVRGGDDAALRVTQRLKLMCVAPSLGGVETLVSMPRFTSHAGLSPAQRAAIGVGAGFMRLALGIEDAPDLIADLEQALAPELDAGGAAAALAAGS
ncbi:MAG TPA: aminotransferase class I/II-fold pyridoxal phosphate-dependent enzyme [Longimicrobiales bacterium]|nr:aminotransferase class I/II-fold pyridoxal phosphate-dependent enzyme [Longimicrobiales bacterium]